MPLENFRQKHKANSKSLKQENDTGLFLLRVTSGMVLAESSTLQGSGGSSAKEAFTRHGKGLGVLIRISAQRDVQTAVELTFIGSWVLTRA